MQEEEKVAFHADWTFNRVHGHFLASKEFTLLLLFVEEFVVVTWPTVVLLLVDDEEEDVAVEEEREVILQLPGSMWDRPGNYHLEGLTSDFTRAHPTGLRMPENCEPT